MTSHHDTHQPSGGITLHSLRPDHLTVFAAREAEALRSGFTFSERDRPTDFVERYPGLETLCERLGLDSDRSIAECARVPSRVLLELARAAQPQSLHAPHDLTAAGLDELVEHLLHQHHHPLRWELNRLSLLIQHLAGVHPHQRDIQALAGGFSLLRDSLLVHMLQEESEAFPLCHELEASQHAADSQPQAERMRGQNLAEPLHRMASGHIEMGDDLDFLARLVQRAGLSNDPDAVLVLQGLRAMEDNLRVHTVVENEILLPAALFTAELLTRPTIVTHRLPKPGPTGG